MATFNECDRCGAKGADLKLYRMLPIPAAPLGSFDQAYLEGHISKLEICQRCVNIVMREANEPEAREAPHA